MAYRRFWLLWNQQFDDPSQEAEYLESLKGRSRLIIGLVTLAALLGSVITVVLNDQTLQMKEQLIDGTCYGQFMQWMHLSRYLALALNLSACLCKPVWLKIVKFLGAETVTALFVLILTLFLMADRYYVIELCGEVVRTEIAESVDWILKKQQNLSTRALRLAIEMPVLALLLPMQGTTRLLVMPSLLIVPWIDFFSSGSVLPLAYLHILFPVAMYGAYIQEANNREQWTSMRQVEIQQLSMKDHYAAALGLLSRLCDCVLQVDQQMCITEGSRALEAMLFLRTSVEGRNLQEFCADSDPDLRFIQDGEPGHCNMRALRLKSSDGASFSVSCYAVQFQHPTGGTRYLIGMTENEQRAPMENRSEAIQPSPLSSSPMNLGRTDAESLHSSLTSVAQQGEISATVEVAQGLPIIASSEEFRLLIDQEMSFEALVARPESYMKFKVWLGQSVKEFLEMPTFNTLPLSMGSRTFFARSVLLKSISLQADGNIFVRVQLCGLKRKKKRVISM
eukprot:TRINITY_DN24352_c0_g1_i1.p1 TRINITY_DN24352_c0_g1~~TRINITY_DN24352_c0_g1_i1.p1  ORF type:complete len:507 (+),score=55.84 TRINITY_DN24352_c0_g1_i1:46-1566(+)